MGKLKKEAVEYIAIDGEIFRADEKDDIIRYGVESQYYAESPDRVAVKLKENRNEGCIEDRDVGPDFTVGWGYPNRRFRAIDSLVEEGMIKGRWGIAGRAVYHLPSGLCMTDPFDAQIRAKVAAWLLDCCGPNLFEVERAKEATDLSRKAGKKEIRKVKRQLYQRRLLE